MTRRHAGRLLAALAALVAGATPARSQMAGLPVFQNAFANRGVTVAANYGRADAVTTYGAAGAWAPSSARFQLSIGAGTAVPDEGESDVTYGGRASAGIRQFAGGSIGVGAFLGIGAARDAELANALAGASAGYRRAMGGGGLSVFVSPYYLVSRSTIAGDAVRSGLVRFGAGVDASFLRRIGVTVGVDAGAAADDGKPGPTATIFGFGVSFAFSAP